MQTTAIWPPQRAGDFLSAVARKSMRNDPRMQGADYAACLNKARSDNPAIDSVYAGAAMNETALRAMLWPLFKSATQIEQLTRRGAETRQYSSDGVHFDSAGNEIHSYTRDR
jgi:hypothetical protein